MKKESQIAIYQTDDERINIEVQVGQDSVWLTQAQLGLLFDRDYKTISKHILNAFKEGELEKSSAVAKFATTHIACNRSERQLSQILGQFK